MDRTAQKSAVLGRRHTKPPGRGCGLACPLVHLLAMRGWEKGETRLPPGYHLDTSDAVTWALRRPDGIAVAYFGVWGATKEGVERAAREDYRERSRAERAGRQGSRWHGDARVR
jgi:hypothetical protein